MTTTNPAAPDRRAAVAPPSGATAEDVLDQARRLRTRTALVVTGLLVAVVVTASLGMSVGEVGVPFADVWTIVWHHVSGAATTGPPLPNDAIVWQIRAPRVLLGLCAGACLSVIGVAVQAMVRNPLADPYVMGVESGAAAAAVGVVYFGRFTAVPLGLTPTVAGFAGALGTLVLVFAMARRNGRVTSVRLLLVGVAVSYALSGLTSFFLFAAHDPDAAGSTVFWLLGGLGRAEWRNLPVAGAVAAASLLAVWFHARRLNALSLGDDSAAALGMDPDRLRSRLLVICALVVAATVSVVGPIGFVGLVIPHMTRMLVGADHRRLVPAAFLLGAVYLLVVDVVARTVVAPGELPIGIVTAVLGTPFFLWLLRRQSGGVGGAR